MRPPIPRHDGWTLRAYTNGHFFYFLFTHPTTSHIHRITLHPFHANDLRSNKSPICTFHVIQDRLYTDSNSHFLFPFPFPSYVQAWLRRHDYDLSGTSHAIWHNDTPNIFWFRLFERVVHCSLILGCSCIYTGSTVNGESHGRTPHDYKYWPTDLKNVPLCLLVRILRYRKLTMIAYHGNVDMRREQKKRSQSKHRLQTLLQLGDLLGDKSSYKISASL